MVHPLNLPESPDDRKNFAKNFLTSLERVVIHLSYYFKKTCDKKIAGDYFSTALGTLQILKEEFDLEYFFESPTKRLPWYSSLDLPPLPSFKGPLLSSPL
jgi:hypothetical protein